MKWPYVWEFDMLLYVTIIQNFERGQYFNLKKIFWETETFFKELDYRFLVERTKIEHNCPVRSQC